MSTFSPKYHDRLTVNITQKTSDALDGLVKATSNNKTDSINRALQIAWFLEEIVSNGGSVYVRRSADSELESVTFV